MDRSGLHYYNSSYPLRYYVFVSEKAENIAELQEKAIAEPQIAQKPKRNKNSSISILAQSDSWVQDATIKPAEDDLSLHLLQFILHKDTTYYLHVFINEQPIKDTPFTFTIGRSPHQEEKEQEAEEIRRREIEARKAREEAQRLKEEELKKEMEERERRAQETEKRAQEALKEHLQQQKEQQLKMEEERKTRKEAAVGGGFDMNKIKNLQKQDPMETKTELKSPTGLLAKDAGNKGVGSKVASNTNKGSTTKIQSPTATGSTMMKTGTIQKPTATTTVQKPAGNDLKLGKSPSINTSDNTVNTSNPTTPASVSQDKKLTTQSNMYGKKPAGTGSFPNKNTKK